VLELCRIIAGPAIGRTLAEYGATVLKITSPNLPDVPFFQVDGSQGKHCADLDLKTPSGRQVFETLLLEADVILDGYRPGSLERLGYGPKQIVKLVESRGKGIVYVSEDCFGPSGPWAGRPGWQQIADCVTGIAWAQGLSMGLDEPVVPPFPMSDYGTGCMGAIAALTGLWKRATEGGSWIGSTSLAQYDIFLLRLGLYDSGTLARLREQFEEEGPDNFYGLRHYDSVDEVSRRALKAMKRVHPELFDEKIMVRKWSRGFNEEVVFVGSAVKVDGVGIGFSRASRPNGFDEATWEGWEVDDDGEITG
jgi:crotonobetainyl-CoA:carnitine CoA-transferase CaiB-like acyl-CoA transferase